MTWRGLRTEVNRGLRARRFPGQEGSEWAHAARPIVEAPRSLGAPVPLMFFLRDLDGNRFYIIQRG